MAKNLKINIKNTQIAEAINLGSLKSKLAKKKEAAVEEGEKKEKPATVAPSQTTPPLEEAPKIKARSKSAFAEGESKAKPSPVEMPLGQELPEEKVEPVELKEKKTPSQKIKTSEELRQEIFAEEIAEQEKQKKEEQKAKAPPIFETSPPTVETILPEPPVAKEIKVEKPKVEPKVETPRPYKEFVSPPDKLGPTGRHMRDLIPPKPQPRPRTDRERPPHAAHPHPRVENRPPRPGTAPPPKPMTSEEAEIAHNKAKARGRGQDVEEVVAKPQEEEELKKGKAVKFKEFRDIKPQRKTQDRSFDARDRHGLRETEEDKPWRKRRGVKMRPVIEDTTIRPAALKVRLPIAIKDLAAEMKLKSSQLIQKLFLQGVVVTLNDLLEDETTVQLLGQEFGCEIAIDTSEEERIRVTGKTIKEEVATSSPEDLVIRPPVVAFMGHVDHGKTSLIDTIRKSNRAAGEAGAITQHIGAFRCKTPVGDIAILDTPGHEAFSAMRARGADVTDIVVLVVAGDEGIRMQTLEAINHARAAKVTIVVAINKCDKPNFNAENVYRQLAENDLLPEAWGGTTITVNCSAVTGQGIPQLLEMLALQAEILELKANPKMRARGSVLESEMHKGMGAVATILVQNGTLHLGDALVFDEFWGRVKTMRDEFGKELTDAGPSTPVEITGLSGLPEAGQEFIVVKSEREAREIAEVRSQGLRQNNLMQKKKVSMENLLQQTQEPVKKVLNLILRADVQGSLEALKIALQKIESKKAEISIIFAGVGEIGESDVQLAAASKAVIIGFHTAIESHADSFVKQYGVQVRLHEIIYHAIDDVKTLMVDLLDKIAIETDRGKAQVKATFKSSHVGIIAGCQVIEGTVSRNNHVRVKRGNELLWKGTISSLKRVKEDVREVQKGFECGILLNGFTDIKEGDIIEAYEVTYITQEL